MIEIEHLSKRYGPLAALDDLNLTIEPGEVLGFIGRNGAGKTTTIRMMMGLLEPTSGTIRLGGHDISTAAEAAKAITGYLPDHPYLYDKLTGLELMRFVAGLYGVPERESERRCRDLLDELALTAQASELVETYSHGMKQRLALAAALVHRPQILVLDEPLVGLDPQGAHDLRRMLLRLRSGGATIFVSTHSLAVAEDVCDRFAVLDHGRLLAVGTLGDLRTRAGQDSGRVRESAAAADQNGHANGATSGAPSHTSIDPSSLESVFLDLIGAREGQW